MRGGGKCLVVWTDGLSFSGGELAGGIGAEVDGGMNQPDRVRFIHGRTERHRAQTNGRHQ